MATDYLDVYVEKYRCAECSAKSGERCQTKTGRDSRLHAARVAEALSHCRHTPAPSGYLARMEWMAEKSKTHKQRRCPGCGLWKVWLPKADAQGWEGADPTHRRCDDPTCCPPAPPVSTEDGGDG